jgi:lipoate-protein ligase B
VPCGIAEFPVTSLDAMGVSCRQEHFDLALQQGLDLFLASFEGGAEKA